MKFSYSDDFFQDDMDYKDFENDYSLGKIDCMQNEYDDINYLHENFDNQMTPFLGQSSAYCKVESNVKQLDEVAQFNNENDEFVKNEFSQFSVEDQLDFHNSSSSGQLSGPDCADGQDDEGGVHTDKRHASNEMERQRRKQYSESLMRVRTVLPDEYIRRARNNVGRKTMKKVSYQVLLQALRTYLEDPGNQPADIPDLKRNLQTKVDDIKKLLNKKVDVLDEKVRNAVLQFIQQANNMLCSK